MSSKTLITLVVLFILINLGIFILLQKDTFMKKEVTQTPQNFSTSQNSLTLPVRLDHPGVSSTSLIYEFRGRVTSRQQIQENTLLTLDISDSEIPDVLVTPGTLIYMEPGSDSTPESATINDIKIGTGVTIIMTYDLGSKSWRITGISILKNLQ